MNPYQRAFAIAFLVVLGGGASVRGTDVSLGSAIADRIDPRGSEDVFSFHLPYQAWVRIYTRGPTDTYGKLMSRHRYIIQQDKNSGHNNNFLIERNLAAGNYYIAVGGTYGPTEWGYYTLFVERVGQDHDACSSAIEIPFRTESGTTGYHDRIDRSGDWDFFRFEVPRWYDSTVERRALYAFTVGSTDTWGELRDSNCRTVNDARRDDDRGTGRNFKILETLNPGETYYLAIRHYGSGTGDYDLHFVVDSYPQSALITQCLNYYAPLTLEGGEAVQPLEARYSKFQIEVPIAGTLRVATQDSTKYPSILLSTGYCGYSTGVLARSTFPGPAGGDVWLEKWLNRGTYYLDVEDLYSYWTTDLVVRVSSPGDVGATCNTATSIRLPDFISTFASVHQEVHYGGDRDVYRVDVPCRGDLTAYTSGSTDTWGELKNSGCTIINQPGIDDDEGLDRNFIIRESVPAGTYYIAVRHYWGATGTGSYRFHVGFYAREDHGNSCGVGTMIRSPSIAGRIDYGGDSDYFGIEVPRYGWTPQTTLTIWTQGSLDTWGELRAPNGTIINSPRSDDDAGDGRNFRIVRAVSPGIYCLGVRHYNSWTTGNYTVHVDISP